MQTSWLEPVLARKKKEVQKKKKEKNRGSPDKGLEPLTLRLKV